jgi:hypothetical protein
MSMTTPLDIQHHWLRWFGNDSILQAELRQAAVFIDGYTLQEAADVVRRTITDRLRPETPVLDVRDDTLSAVLGATDWIALTRVLLQQWGITLSNEGV